MAEQRKDKKAARWPVVVLVVVGLLMAGAAVAYHVVVRKIRAQLAAVVRQSLGADLREADVAWRVPYGVVVRGVRVVAPDADGRERDVFRAARIDLTLDGRPGDGKPTVIRSLDVDEPSVDLACGEPGPCNNPPAGTPAGEANAAPVVCPPSPTPCRPRFSFGGGGGKVRVEHLKIVGGAVRYEDRSRPGVPPTALRDIRLEVRPPQGGGGAQPFVLSAAGAGATRTTLQAEGSIDMGDLVLALTKVVAQLDLGPNDTNSTPLPAAAAAVVREYRLGGQLHVEGAGCFPLRQLAQSTYRATAEATGASADVPEPRMSVEGGRVQLVVDSSPLPEQSTIQRQGAGSAGTPAVQALPGADSRHREASTERAIAPGRTSPAGVPGVPTTSTESTTPTAPATRPAPWTGPADHAAPPPAPASSPPLHVRLVAPDTRLGTNALNLTGGEFWFDPGRERWKVSALGGHLETPPPARADQATTGPSGPVVSAAVPQVKANPVGRVDFTGAADGPTRLPPGRSWADVVRYDVLAFPRDAVWRPGRDWPLPIDHLDGGSIRIADGVIAARNLAGTYGGDRITLVAARVPIPRNVSDLWRVETRVEEMSGTLTCSQPGPCYPEGVADVFEALRPTGTFALGARLTLRHGRAATGEKLRDDYAVDVVADGKASSAVTSRRIPLAHLRGKATVTPLAVAIDTTQAESLGGVVTARGTIVPRSKPRIVPPGGAAQETPMAYRGEAWVRDIDMALLAKAIGTGGGGEGAKPVQKLSGRGNLDVTFSGTGEGGPIPPLKALRAEGNLQIFGADFVNDPSLGKVKSDVKTKKAAGTCDVAVVFSAADGAVTIHQAAMNSPSLAAVGSGTVTFDKKLNVRVVAVPIGDVREEIRKSNFPILSETAGALAGLVKDVLTGAAGTLLYQYQVTGSVDDPDYRVIPSPVLTDAAAQLFGQMLKAGDGGPATRPGDSLLDAVKDTTRQAGDGGR